jgi:hypothetical protein
MLRLELRKLAIQVIAGLFLRLAGHDDDLPRSVNFNPRNTHTGRNHSLDGLSGPLAGMWRVCAPSSPDNRSSQLLIRFDIVLCDDKDRKAQS